MAKNPAHVKREDAFPSQEENRKSNRSNTDAGQVLGRQIGDLVALLQVDRELTERPDLDHVLDSARRWIAHISNTDRVWIFLLQEEDMSRLFGFPDDYGSQEYELIKHTLTQSDYHLHEIKDQLAIPILNNNEPLGAFLVKRANPFSKAEADYLVLLANRCAAAIVNARLHNAIRLADQDTSKFVSLVTHELRNPLTCIKGYADLLSQGMVGPINDQQRVFVDTILRNAEWMSTLISDLADYSRIEHGNLEIEKRIISVQNCLDEVLQNLLPKFEEKHQNVEVDFEPDLPDAYADPDRLIQIMKNLLRNANRFTPAGGDIRVVANGREDFVCVEVADNGIGISPEDQTRLFSKFFRSEDPLVREEPGWGLGLYIARRLVDAMGGDIGYRSKPGQGSSFWFTIPIIDANLVSEGN